MSFIHKNTEITGYIEIYCGNCELTIYTGRSAKCTTEWHSGAYFFCEKDNPVENARIRADLFLKQSWKIKIIGNIFDNPELIKKA